MPVDALPRRKINSGPYTRRKCIYVPISKIHLLKPEVTIEMQNKADIISNNYKLEEKRDFKKLNPNNDIATHQNQKTSNNNKKSSSTNNNSTSSQHQHSSSSSVKTNSNSQQNNQNKKIESSIIAVNNNNTTGNVNGTTNSSNSKHHENPNNQSSVNRFKYELIESRYVVANTRKAYVPFCKDEVHYSDDDATLVLQYPQTGCQERFLMLAPKIVGEYSPVIDIKETTQQMVQFCVPQELVEAFGDTKQGTIRQIIKACNRKSLTDLKSAIEDFNSKIQKVQKLDKEEKLMLQKNGIDEEGSLDLDFVTHVLEQSYARSVAPVSHLLSKSRGFSNTVYGEVKYNLVNEFIKVTGLRSDHIFLDMGSGIGNVVLQVAGQCGATSYGIEIMTHLHEIGLKQQQEFESRMHSYGKSCGKIVLREGNFLDDSVVDQVIPKADVIFINNYIFDAELMYNILQKLLDVKDSVKIITLKSLNAVDKRVNARNSHSIRSIFQVKEYYFGQGFVSWMAEGGSYFVQTIDRSSIAQFAE